MAPHANQSVAAGRTYQHRPASAAPSLSRLSRLRGRSRPSCRSRRDVGLLSLALLLVVALTSSAQAASVGLGTAGRFSVLGATAVSNTGPSTLAGDVGVSPGTALTGFPPATVGGTTHANDAVARQAQSDLTTAYNDAAGRSSTATVSGDLAGRTLSPGVYTSASSLGLSGNLTLNAQGNPNAVFVFQAGSTLTTGSGSRVLLIGGAQACNVFWQVGSSATIGTATAFTGNILALQSITLTTGATLNGRALARNAAVTLDTNTVTSATCATAGGTGGTGGTPNGTGGTTGLPVAVTGSASLIGPDHARLGAVLRPGTAVRRYYFEFGTTTRYGRRTRSGHAGPGPNAISVHAQARRLRPGTTYHYRIVTVGPGGQITRGADRTFRTRSRRVRSSRHSPAHPPLIPRRFTGSRFGG